MQALSCALLVAAANGFYSPQQKAKVAPRALARAAKEGQAAAGEKQRIAWRSVQKEGQPSKRIDIHGDTQKSAQQFNAHAPARRFRTAAKTGNTHRSSSATAWSASASSSSAPTSSRSGARLIKWTS